MRLLIINYIKVSKQFVKFLKFKISFDYIDSSKKKIKISKIMII